MPPRVAPATNARGPHATAATGRRNLPLLPLLLLAAGPRTASAQAPVNDAFYLGEGVFLPGGFGQSVAMTSATSAQECDTFCFAGNGLTPAPAGTLVGFTYEPGATTECTCLENSVAGTNQAIEGVFEIPGSNQFQYCYYCASEQPSSQPSSRPSSVPSELPSGRPSSVPSELPSGRPSSVPSELPSGQPSSVPSELPSGSPSENPSGQPSGRPSSTPSERPSEHPSELPSGQPSGVPSENPSEHPSENPSGQPSSTPSENPSGAPSTRPSSQPSGAPSQNPSGQPSSAPSGQPSSSPSQQPSSQPSSQPSAQPSTQPSESPSANPSQGCDNIRTDCGWGIFNPWTCRCDCPVGICLDDNGQCYNPCRDTIHTNPWAGCAPGWDCPWYPDDDAGHCLSEIHQPNNFEIYRTAKECCDEHYGGSSACVADSKSEADIFPWPIHFPGLPTHRPFMPPVAEDLWGTERSHRPRWFPDLTNKLNCVFGRNYEHWMTEDGFEAEYLFSNDEDCCEKWYPARGSSCPDTQTAVNPEAQDEPWLSASYPMQNYYFPDFSRNSCGYGRDYPAWMAINGYEKSYLFREGFECCDRFFTGAGNCPFENEDQLDYSWTEYEANINNLDDMPQRNNHTYYPAIEARTCVNGTDYPPWMAEDTDFMRLYLFKDLRGCCNRWFGSFDLTGCMNNVIQGIYTVTPCPINRPEFPCDPNPTIANFTEHRLGMWYPDIDGYRCKDDRAMPDWMLQDGYHELYLFNTQAQCCAAFGYC